MSQVLAFDTDGNGKSEKLPNFDFVIMNPPFTRTTGRQRREGGSLFGFLVDEPIRQRVVAAYNGVRES